MATPHPMLKTGKGRVNGNPFPHHLWKREGIAMARTHPLLKKRRLGARANSSCLPSSSLLEKCRRCGHGHSISLQEGSRGGGGECLYTCLLEKWKSCGHTLAPHPLLNL